MNKIKKTVWLIGWLLCWGGTLDAYEPGDIVLSAGMITSPVELGTDWGEVNIENAALGITHDAKLGEPGVGLDFQAFYFLHPRIAVGVDLSHQLFITERSSGWYVDGGTRQQRYLLASRIFINPESKYKVYLALGGGIARTKMTVDFQPHERFKDTGFGYYAGLGVERNFSKHWGYGLEVRYSGNEFEDSHLSKKGEPLRVYPKANYVSGILRINYKL